MNKHELAIIIKDKINIPTLKVKDIEAVLNCFTNIIIDGVVEKKSIHLHKFGKFLLRISGGYKKFITLNDRARTIDVPKKAKIIFKCSPTVQRILGDRVLKK